MQSIEALSFGGDKFSTSAVHDGDVITVQFVGDGNINAITPVEAVLTRLHTEAQRMQARVVALDFEKLEFMNSACFKKVLTWIGRVQQMDSASQYRIRFISNPKMLWQRRSFHALRCFAVDLITLDT